MVSLDFLFTQEEKDNMPNVTLMFKVNASVTSTSLQLAKRQKDLMRYIDTCETATRHIRAIGRLATYILQ